MGEFTLLGFAAFATELITEVEHAKHHALEKAGKIVEDESKRVIGTYEYGWAPLKPATIERKGADEPLLGAHVSGPWGDQPHMRDSISHYFVKKDEVSIGSPLDYAVYQELGTATIPPRSFLAQAAIHKEKEIVELIGKQVVKALMKG